MSQVQMRLLQELPIVTCWAEHNGQCLELEALVDTGSAGTMPGTESAHTLGMSHTRATSVYSIYGVGSRSPVYTHWLDRLIIGDHGAVNVLAFHSRHGLRTSDRCYHWRGCASKYWSDYQDGAASDGV